MAESRLAPSFLPATAVLELTYRCNHSCIFCSCPWEAQNGNFSKLPECTTNQWKDTISTLCKMGVCNIAFTGGEPLMRHDIYDLVKHAASCTTEHIETSEGSLKSKYAPPKLYLISNGEHIDKSILNMCKAYGVQLSMSLPGLDTFKTHTGFDNIDRVLQNFSEAKAAGLLTVANITVTKLNLGELDRIISAAIVAGAHQILLNRFIPGGRGLQHIKDLSLSVDDIKTMLNIAEDVLSTSDRFGSLGTEIPKCVIGTSSYKHIKVSTRCSASLGFFVIGPSGYIRVCNHSPVRLTNISQISELKKHEYWRTFTQKRYLPNSCRDCSDRYDCDGGCREAAHVVGGDVCSPDVLLTPDELKTIKSCGSI